MIKGIYNENEFYNNFYWDNKFQEEVKNKSAAMPSFAEAASKIKELDQLFWAMQDASKAGIKSQESLVEFYQEVFKILGYKSTEEKRDTQAGTQYTLFLNEELKESPELFGILVDSNETGLFEASPLVLASTDEIPAEDRELSDILQEELQDSEKPPKWVLVGSHNALFIIERNKWSFGRFIKIEWQEIFLQRDIKPYELIWGLASKAMLCPETGSSAHEEFDDNSHRHAFEVTTELRESVRESIELLINEMIYARKEARQGYLNKEEEAAIYAKELSHDALFYVYRLIFLLYLESQGDDSDLLPLKSEIYRMGYSLEKLLELDFVTIMPNTPDYDGTFLQESLDKIFSLIYNGFNPEIKPDMFRDTFSGTGFLVKGIKSDLFNPDITKHLKGIKLRNGVLQQVLIKLSLTRVQAKGKKQRARVSYANLGINQLGAVYEGLLSYSGFFAQEELHALKPTSVKQSDIDNGKELEQVYLAPKSLVEKYRTTKEKKYKLTDDNVVLDESGNPKIYKKGSFIYRLAGRDRQKLASFYTPESLTKCTVKYSLKVLFENKKTLKDLWDVKILEPAMGSGAFLNEAVNQIADRILELEVRENVGELKTPKDKQKRLWEIKYQLISNNVFGVDLNPTAIELARFSLWLNCIGAGKEPPQFTGRLKVGNSLIGARFKKGADGIYPWLLLDDGMMNYGKRLKDYDADQYEKLQSFRKDLISSKLESSHNKIKALQLKAEGVLKELITSKDADKKEAAYDRLKLCGDLWCSAFFLTGDDLKNYPTKHEALCDAFASILENGSIDSKLMTIVEEKYNSERFFHWEIEFPEIIATGGFDLILGNPPWVSIEWQEKDFLLDYAPIPNIFDFDASKTTTFIKESLGDSFFKHLSFGFISYSGYIKMLESSFYSPLIGMSKNTYKGFLVLALSYASQDAALGLIYEDGIYEDQKGEKLRELLYHRFYFHFSFVNQKYLFSEIGNTRSYGVNIFGKKKNDISFLHIGNLFLPKTIEESFRDIELRQDVSPPGIKDEKHEWETRGHRDRIVTIDKAILEKFSRINLIDSNYPPLLNLHLKQMTSFTDAVAGTNSDVGAFIGDQVIAGGMLEAKSALQDNVIEELNEQPDSIEKVVLTAPHLCGLTFFGQQTKDPYENHRSYSVVNLEEIKSGWLPRCLYQANLSKIDKSLQTYAIGSRSYRSFYRLAYRRRFDVQSERCFYPAIIPFGVSHIDLIESLAAPDEGKIILLTGYCSSLLYEGIARIKNLKDCRYSELKKFPINASSPYSDSIKRRVLSLSALSSDFDNLIDNQKSILDANDDSILCEGISITKNKKITVFKSPADRERIALEIDALVFLSLNLGVDVYLGVYETLMPVLKKYDQSGKFNRVELIKQTFKSFQERGW